MGFGEKLSQLAHQFQRLVSSNQDKIHGAVDTVGSVANRTTKGKFSDKIAKAGEMAKAGVGKLGSDGKAATDAEGAAGGEGEAEAAAGDGDSATGGGEGAEEQEGQPSEPPAGT
jgi:hypothetical protein